MRAWLAAASLAVYVLASTETSKNISDTLLWGPYRPNLYFGVRPRLPQGVLTGLLWARVEDFQSVQENFRHTCEQNEHMAGYGWDAYDVRSGGRQVIHDVDNHLDITTHFIKFPGGDHGGSWGARVTGKVRDGEAEDTKSTVVFYVGMEGFGSLKVANSFDELGYQGAVEIEGQTSNLGGFKLEVTEGPSSNKHPTQQHPSWKDKPLDRSIVRSMQLPEVALWQAKPVMFNEMKGVLDAYVEKYGKEHAPPPWQMFTIPNSNLSPGNLHFVQKVFEGSFEFDILYNSASNPKPVTSEILGKAIGPTTKAFHKTFDSVFPAQAPFNKKKYAEFGRSLFSNLLGGIGYFYGESLVDMSYASEYEEENEGFWTETAEARSRVEPQAVGPYSLFTSIPSRPFFPRGFLWDEGFHLIPIADWDVELTLEILKSWFNTMDEDGWIAREQILGLEARSKVPAEYQTQYPHYANPPTLFIVLEILAERAEAKHTALSEDQKEYIRSTLRELYPLLKRHYAWYRKTQRGDIKGYDRTAPSPREAYRWRGRSLTHCLTSGLDDYPRPDPPHPGELHIDLISWMGLMSRTMSHIATRLGEGDDADEFRSHEQAIIKNIDALHWSDAEASYCDATIDEFEEHKLVCHKGYVTIFPFLAGLLAPDAKHLGAVLDVIRSPDELWSPFGIRSLSKSSPLYASGENYWCSPVWININYLVLTNLRRIALAKGPHQATAAAMHDELRRNLVETVFNSWADTGFAWEQYNPETGVGQRTQHFTGWTSLAAKIMAMPEIAGSKKDAPPPVVPEKELVYQSSRRTLLLVCAVSLAVCLLLLRYWRGRLSK